MIKDWMEKINKRAQMYFGAQSIPSGIRTHRVNGAEGPEGCECPIVITSLP